MATGDEVTLVTPGLEKRIVILVATLCERSVKATTPPEAVTALWPCNTPLPALRLAVTTVAESFVRKLPNLSRIWRIGCCVKVTPAVAVAEGCVWSANLLAAPGISQSKPSLEFAETLTNEAVPAKLRFPIASGVPAAGRTLTFCQVNLQAKPPLLFLVTVKTN